MSLLLKIESQYRWYMKAASSQEKKRIENPIMEKMYHKIKVDTNDQLQERAESYKPTVTDRNAVAKLDLRKKKKRIEMSIAEENVAIKKFKRTRIISYKRGNTYNTGPDRN